MWGSGSFNEEHSSRKGALIQNRHFYLIWMSLLEKTHPKSKKVADLDESISKNSSKIEEILYFGWVRHDELVGRGGGKRFRAGRKGCFTGFQKSVRNDPSKVHYFWNFRKISEFLPILRPFLKSWWNRAITSRWTRMIICHTQGTVKRELRMFSLGDT